MNAILKVICVLPCYLQIVNALEFKYHSNEELGSILKKFPSSVLPPLRASTSSIGQTNEGNDLWVTEITATKANALNVPNVKLIANIHGNEAVGRVVLLHFLHFLKDAYVKNDTIAWLLNNTRIYVMPSMNPDGFNESQVDYTCLNHGKGRENGRKNYDLNRNFPDYYVGEVFELQAETKAVMKWMEKIPFILSVSLHGGALVANYPFDTVKVKQSNKYGTQNPSLTPDNDVFIHLAKTYSNNHPQMHKKNSGCKSNKFEGGITNGAEWYTFTGSMQDYNYFKHGCMELTLEISCCKYPEEKELEQFWISNKEALIAYCLQAHQGIAGQVLDRITKRPIGNAELQIVGRNMSFYSYNSTGEYRRVLRPGIYTIEVKAKGYYTTYQTFNLSSNAIVNLYLLNSSMSTTTVRTTLPSQSSTHVDVPEDILNNSISSLTKEEPTVGELTMGSSIRCCEFGIVLLLLTTLLLYLL